MDGLRSFWKKIGPGLTTGASDDDNSGLAIYSQVGAQTGFQLVWTALFTFPLMAVIQEICARIGLVTGHGLAGNLKRNYPRYLMVPISLLVVAGSSLNIGADIAAMSASTNLLLPQVPAALLTVLFTLIILAFMVFSSYRVISSVLKWTALTLFIYFLVPFTTQTDWPTALRSTFVPSLTFNRQTILLILAILGTTISPYLFFWQASMEVEEKASKVQRIMRRWIVTKHELKDMKEDVVTGMFLSNVVMWFIIVTAAVTLFPHGIREIGTIADVAAALKPIAGNSAYLIFAIGSLSVGFLAIPILAGSSAYALSETFSWKEGVNKQFHQAKPFYGVMIVSTLIGMLIPLAGIDPIKALFYTGVFYGITSPILIFAIMHVANNKKVMGRYTNSKLTNFFGYLTFSLMAAAVVGLFFS